MLQTPAHLGRTGQVQAAQVHALGVAVDRAPAVGAVLRQGERRGVCRTFFGQIAHELRDDLACLLHLHQVAGPEILRREVVEIVQGRPLDHRAREEHRLQLGHRRQGARLAHLHRDAQQAGLRGFGGKLVGDHPARGLAGASQHPALGQAVHLHHHAVRRVVQLEALRAPFGAVRDDLLDVRAAPPVGVHRQAEPAQALEDAAMRVRQRLRSLRGVVEENVQGPRRHGPRVQQFQRARRRVARVAERLQPLLLPGAVQAFQGGPAHVDLAPQLHFRRGAGNLLRQPRQRAGVRRHIVPAFAVAARRRAD